MEKNYCVYLAHTSIDIYHEALFSILSFLKNDPQRIVTVLIYTDNPDFFYTTLGTLPKCEIIYIDSDRIKKWSGEINYIHRVKIETLLLASQTYKGNMLYLDSDTFVHKPIQYIFQKIQDKNLLMHRFEANFATHKGRQIPRYRKKLKQNGALHPIGTDFNFEYWNAGAIGFNSQFRHLLEKSLKITDSVYSFYQMFTVEQMAISYSFSKFMKIQPVEDTVYHYWNFKEFRIIIRHFLQAFNNLPAETLLEKISLVNPIELHKPKLEWEKHSSAYRKIKKFLSGKTWFLPEYKFMK